VFLALYQYRQFVWRQSLSDLRHRYAGTGLGIAWNIIHPLGIVAIYVLVFPFLFHVGAKDFTLRLCSGFFPWVAFAECIRRGADAFTANAGYLKKLAIPEIVFSAETSLATALGLAINFGLVIILAMVLGIRPAWTWLLIPIPLMAMLILGFAIGLLAGTLNVFFRDIGEWVSIIMQIAFWTVPIVYRTERLPPIAVKALRWHPVGPEIEAIRNLLLDGRLPDVAVWPGMVIWPAIVLMLASRVFGKLRKEMRDLL
jgi:ABC-type polysaccharide/polyol phosphate export permease